MKNRKPKALRTFNYYMLVLGQSVVKKRRNRLNATPCSQAIRVLGKSNRRCSRETAHQRFAGTRAGATDRGEMLSFGEPVRVIHQNSARIYNHSFCWNPQKFDFTQEQFLVDHGTGGNAERSKTRLGRTRNLAQDDRIPIDGHRMAGVWSAAAYEPRRLGPPRQQRDDFALPLGPVLPAYNDCRWHVLALSYPVFSPWSV
jgi:hypothetical protein